LTAGHTSVPSAASDDEPFHRPCVLGLQHIAPGLRALVPAFRPHGWAGRCSPGAVRLYRKGLLNDDDSYRASNEIPGIRGRIGATPEQTSEIVYCSRLGYRVMLMWIVMTHLLGYENVRI
jgi:hypothetical protein